MDITKAHPLIPCDLIISSSSWRTKVQSRLLCALAPLRGLSTYIIYLLLFPFQLYGQAPVTSLDSILSEIEQHHATLKAYELKAKSYAYSAESASSWMAPMVGGGTFMTPYPGQSVMDGRDKGSIMFQLEQSIPNPAKQKAKQRYIHSQGDIELAERLVILNDLKAQAKTIYYNWIIAEQRINLLQENDILMRKMKQVEEVRYTYSKTLLANVFKAEARIAENQNMLDMQKAEIAKSRAWLNALMNRPGNSPLNIDSSQVPRFVPATSLDTLALADKRKDISRMNAEIESMKMGIDAMKSESKPEFKIRFDHMSPLGSMMPQAYSAMAMVSIPIAPWSSKMYKSEAKAMEMNSLAMQEQRKAMLVESQGMLYGMQAEIRNMEKRILNMKEKIIPALQRAFDANFQAYSENRQELPAILSDWEALNMMKDNVLDEKQKLYQMIVSYEKELYR